MKIALFLFAAATVRLAASDAAMTPYHVTGFAAETCSCPAPCLCDITGVGAKSCRGVGTYVISKGDFGGEDLSGVAIAYAYDAGDWTRLYIDAPSEAKRVLAEQFFRASRHGGRSIESVSAARIEVVARNGGYQVRVNDGKTLEFSVTPMIGKDQKTPIIFSNIDSELMGTYFQGESSEGTLFLDGEKRIGIPAGRSATYNDKWDVSGSLRALAGSHEKNSIQ